MKVLGCRLVRGADLASGDLAEVSGCRGKLSLSVYCGSILCRLVPEGALVVFQVPFVIGSKIYSWDEFLHVLKLDLSDLKVDD